ncbi:MAG: class F sortase [Patescibacteria group bacterium]
MDILLTRALMIVSVAATLLSGMLFLDYVAIASSPERRTYITVLPTPQEYPISVASPSRLVIPRIQVDALIERVGITARGEMDVPKSQITVGWLETGPRPGETGSAVIAGHYGQNGAKTSVFDSLSILQPRDTIYVIDEDGITTTFIVREKNTYSPDADASAVFSAADDGTHLNLVTCDGPWNAQSQEYQRRLVIFADKQ